MCHKVFPVSRLREINRRSVVQESAGQEAINYKSFAFKASSCGFHVVIVFLRDWSCQSILRWSSFKLRG
ncbi:unnamed protein product [Porites evermanni]|uniref:Uncharacterized protein n=1 Tax=Porites evermanni TaxID=104178 RepID=A0ABN8PG72_9CNID|nr:unnamed protein product [Porites evermanni]